MDAYKLKVKIGEHEFEAEGPVEIVQGQFAAFKELIASVPQPKPVADASAVQDGVDANSTLPGFPHVSIEKILRADGRLVSLTARCQDVEEAILLLLLGQKDLRNNQSVTGAEVMDGLKQSGYVLPRIDRTMDKLGGEGAVITIGITRGRRYRLTNQGLGRALTIAKEVMATVP